MAATPDQASGPFTPLYGRNGERLVWGGTAQGDGTGAALVQIASNIAASSNLTQTPQNAASVQLVAANTARKGLYIYNNQGVGTANLYVACAATASTSAFTFRLAPNTGATLPVDYTGVVTGIWDASGAGSAQVSEFS